MDSVAFARVKDEIGDTMDRVCDGHAPVVITREDGGAVVLISLADYEALEETAYLLGNSANAGRLAESVRDIERGKLVERSLIE